MDGSVRAGGAWVEGICAGCGAGPGSPVEPRSRLAGAEGRPRNKDGRLPYRECPKLPTSAAHGVRAARGRPPASDGRGATAPGGRAARAARAADGETHSALATAFTSI